MPFILPPNKLFNLNFLREEYQKEKDIDLDAPSSLLGRPIFLGGTDVVNRRAQIEFLNKIYTVLKPNIYKEEEIKTPEEYQANLTSARVILAAVLYVQSKINRSKRNSVLYRLLEDDLGISKENALDEEDQEICILAAKRLVTSSLDAFNHANSALPFNKKITEKEWDEFREFLCSRSIKKAPPDFYAHYPITNITQKLFGTAGAYTGATLGMLGGEALSHSSPASSSKIRLTALVGSTLVVFGSAGPAGVAFLAPAIAERLISAFCSISLAHILGVSMGFLGQVVGVGVGLPLDLAYSLILATCNTIGSYNSNQSLLTGIRIADGMTVLNGVVLEATSVDEVSPEYQQIMATIQNGELYINGKLVNISEAAIGLPPEFVDLVKIKINYPVIEEIEEVNPFLIPS